MIVALPGLSLSFLSFVIVTRNDLWMLEDLHRTKQIYVSTSLEAEGEDLDPVKLA